MKKNVEKIYCYSPVWLQNLAISLYGFGYRNRRLGAGFQQYANGFSCRESYTTEQMNSYIISELKKVLLTANNHVPYYRDLFNKSNIDQRDLEKITLEKLSKFPISLKQNLRDKPERFLVDKSERKQKLRAYSTSGSTGTPTTCFWTDSIHRKFIAAREIRSFGWAKTSIRKSRSMVGGRLVVPSGEASPPYYRYNFVEKQVYFSAYHISPKTVSNYLEGFNRYKPHVLTGYAYSYYLLARMMREQGLALNYKPDALVLSSEKLTSEMKAAIQEVFHARAYEEYSLVENCILVTECEKGNLHVNQDFGILEIVDDSGQKLPAGQPGRIIATGLINDIQPLIRYDTGDYGIMSEEQCSCGRDQFPVIQEIVGRLEDVVVGIDGREMVRFHGIFIDLPHVLEGQVIQEEPDFFRVRIITSRGFGNSEKQLIKNRFEERLGKVKVRIEEVKEIKRTERGKFRAVISKVKR